MSVSLFTPIVQSLNPKENLGALRLTTGFFNFGQTCYRVTPISRDQVLCLEKANHQKPSGLGVLLRVVAIMTIVIPLFMIIGAMIYRAANKFEVSSLEANGQFSDLLPEIQKLICQKIPLDSLALSLVNKQLNSFFKIENPTLSRNRAMMIAVGQSLKLAQSFHHVLGLQSHRKIAEFLFETGSKERAIAILNKALLRSDASVAANVQGILQMMAKCDLDEALKIAKQCSKGSAIVESEILYVISLGLIPIDLEKAYEIQASLRLDKNQFFCQAAVEIAKNDIEKGLKLLRTIPEYLRLPYFIEIIEHLQKGDPLKAEEFYEEFDDFINTHGSNIHKTQCLLRNNKIMEAIQFAQDNEERQAFPLIAKQYVKVNPLAALEWVKTLDRELQFYSMVEIVKGTQNPEDAKQLIEAMKVEAMIGEGYARLFTCVELMAEFDVKRALELAYLIEDKQKLAKALILVFAKSNHDVPEAENLHNSVLDILRELNAEGVLKQSVKIDTYLYLAKTLHNLNTLK